MAAVLAMAECAGSYGLLAFPGSSRAADALRRLHAAAVDTEEIPLGPEPAEL